MTEKINQADKIAEVVAQLPPEVQQKILYTAQGALMVSLPEKKEGA